VEGHPRGTGRGHLRKGLIGRALAAATLLTALLGAPTAASADNITVASDGTGATIRVATTSGHGGSGSSSGASDRTCTWTVTQANTPEPFKSIWVDTPPPAGETPGSGQWARWDCSDGTAGISWLPNSRPVVAPVSLAREASRHLPLPAPQISVNPPAGQAQLVNLPTWLWVSPLTWGVRAATASVPGLAATATATPTRVTWTMGDGGRVVCHGAGTAYSSRFAPGSASPTCGYVYRHGSARAAGGAYTVTATTTWRITWTATIGTGGSLPSISRSSQISLRVAEAQAVN